MATTFEFKTIVTNATGGNPSLRIDVESRDTTTGWETYQIIDEAGAALKTLRFFCKKEGDWLKFTIRAAREEFNYGRKNDYSTYNMHRKMRDTSENRNWISLRISYAAETMTWGNAE